MKRLWKTVPPVMSDVLGFEAVLNATDGLGIIDDPSRYKPVTAGRGGGRMGGGRPEGGRGFGGGGMETHGGWGMSRHGEGGRPDGRGFGGGPGGPGGHGGRGGRGGDLRVVDSEIRNEDIITGTEKKVMDAFYEAKERMNPAFVLLCHAPSSSMIGSDLEADAERITAETGLPAAYVKVDGSKDYLYGVSATLETMGRLLLTRRETRPGTVNILGANSIDWTEDALAACESWLRENGFAVLSRWGMKDTAENLQGAAAASVNLVVSAAGLRLARYMEETFDIPYVTGAPFGIARCEALLRALSGEETAKAEAPSGEPATLVVGEQLMAEALREALEARGLGPVRTASFFEMDKALMRPGDVKLSWEDLLRDELQNESVKLVCCDPDCRPMTDRTIRWIDLPNPASHSVVEAKDAENYVNDRLDAWLEERLK